ISSRRTGEKSQIVCIKHRGDLHCEEIAENLQNQNIIISPRGDRLRIAPHFYNIKEEIEKLAESLP
ncbi:MAG: hypothetical protein H0W45_11745, partial [Acidobacteria bacterium]|nr:hypothetical protein [Acidobacteriota bacterium]